MSGSLFSHTAHKAPSGAGASPTGADLWVSQPPGPILLLRLTQSLPGTQQVSVHGTRALLCGCPAFEIHTKAEELVDPVHGVLDIGGMVFQAVMRNCSLLKTVSQSRRYTAYSPTWSLT